MHITTSTDRIERTVVLRAVRGKVWHALTDAAEFGKWFGVSFAAQTMAVGDTLRGPVTNPGYEHLIMEIIMERIEPQYLMSWRWHPAAIDPGVDYSDEPMTLVEFALDDCKVGTRVTVTESGLDRLPPSRRTRVIRLNTEGWDEQMTKLERYVDGA